MDANELLKWAVVAIGFLLLFWILARVAYVEDAQATAGRDARGQATAETPEAQPAEEAAAEPELTPLKIPPTIPHFGSHSGPMVLSAHGGGWGWPKRLGVYRRRHERPIGGPPKSE